MKVSFTYVMFSQGIKNKLEQKMYLGLQGLVGPTIVKKVGLKPRY